jgi:Mg2+-importing ATPase
VLPYTPLAHVLGFRPLPGTFFAALAGIVTCYLVLIEIGKYWFYRLYHAPATPPPRHRRHGYRVHRRAARFAAHTLQPARSRDASQGTPVRQDSKVPAG